MRVLPSILWLAAELLCAAALRAAAPGPEVGRPFVRVYSPAESGATDDVPCAVQDARGVMLFGTRSAVLEFDGETWRRLPVPTKGMVHSLAATADGTVWVQADGEVGRFLPAADGARRYESLLEKIPAAQRARFDSTTAIAVGGRDVWVAAAGALLRWTGDGFVAYAGREREVAKLICPERDELLGRYANGDTFRLGAGEPQPLLDLPSLSMRFEWLSPLGGEGRWLFAPTGEALSVAEKVGTASRITRLPGAIERVRSGVRLADGGYAFLILRGGVVLLDANLNLRAQAGVADGLPIGRANSLYADRSGGVWVCAANALVRIADRLPVTMFDAATGLERASLNVISPTRMVPLRRSDTPKNAVGAPSVLAGTRADLLNHLYRQDGRLYAQLSNGGVLAYDYEQRRFVAAPELGLAFMSESSPGGIIARDEFALKFFPTGSTETHEWSRKALAGSPTSADASHFVCATEESMVLVARGPAGWQSALVPHGFSGSNFMAAGESADTWWLCSREKIERLRLEGGRIVARDAFGPTEGIAPQSVHVFARHGRDWLALTKVGLRRFDSATQRFEPWTRLGADLADGTRFVRALLCDGTGRAWVIVQREPRDDGTAVLLAIEPDGRRREISRDVRLRLGRLMQVVLDPEAVGGEKLWIIGFDSLACVDLARWPLAAERERIAVKLRSAQIAGGAALALTGDQAAFTETPAALQLSFAAAYFPVSGRVEYRTRLEGLESSWTEWRTAAAREFVNLPAGDYIFQVQARHDDAGGEAASYAFAVLPPWWRTPPALAAWLLGFGGAAIGFGRWRGRTLRRQNEKLGQLVAARTAELTTSEEQLRVARDAAEAANRAKSVFLAHMSHELRTPLNGILGYAQVLRRDPVQSEAARTRLGVIVDSGEHLLALINEVLDLAKVEAGKMELRASDVSLDRLARGVADLVRARCEEKQLAFAVEIAPGLPRLVRTDEQKLRQVLLNLLGNAIKFTAQGRVTLSIAPVKDGRVRFAVEDTGPGISSERLAVLFTAFDSSTVQRGQGTGLGLVLSQRMADLLGGRIAVSSVSGQGSRFWFDLPLPEVGSAEPFQRAAQRSAIAYRGPRRRLLVVDDEAINRAVLRELLEPLGFAIDEAADGAAALAAARVAPPDAILLDLRFTAGIDGFEIARQLRTAPEFARTKVIAVSASVFESDRHEALAAGCDAFLAKPFNEEQLFALLGTTLGLEWERAEPAQAAPEAAALPLADAVRVGLLELARQGDAVSLRARLAELAKVPAHAAFARELDELAASFQMKRLRELLSEK